MKMKKILFAVLAAVTFFAFASGVASADEIDHVADVTVAESEAVVDGETVVDGEAVVDGETVADGETVVDGETVANGEITEEDVMDEIGENVFALLYSMTADNADKIFALLSFVGTLVLAFIYRKGLLPAISSAVSKLCEAANLVAEQSDENRNKIEADTQALHNNICDVSSALTAISEVLAEIDERIKAIEQQGGETEAIKRVLTCEVDMLSDLFLTSSIPEYQKENVNKRISDMKRELCADDEKQKN